MKKSNKKLWICILITMMLTLVMSTASYAGSTGKITTSSSSGNTCAVSKCTKKVTSGSDYCSSHTCKKSGCYKYADGANGYCISHGGKKNPYNYNMKDYSDYEDFYEDAYDDFEGIDEAEDYWNEYGED